MKTTNVQKQIGLLPQDMYIIYDLAFEYKMHIDGIITFHTCYSNTSHVHGEQWGSKPIQGWCSTQYGIAFPRMGSLLFLTQEITKQILSRATRKTRGFRSNQILGKRNKAI